MSVPYQKLELELKKSSKVMIYYVYNEKHGDVNATRLNIQSQHVIHGWAVGTCGGKRKVGPRSG